MCNKITGRKRVRQTKSQKERNRNSRLQVCCSNTNGSIKEKEKDVLDFGL